MAKITIQFEVMKTTEVDDGWDVVDAPMPSCGGLDKVTCTTANGPAPTVALDDGDRKLKRLLGMFVIKIPTGLSQARLNEYVRAVQAEKRAGKEADLAYAATHVRQPRHRTRRCNDRDFAAIVCKWVLYVDAAERFGRMMNWAKVFKFKPPRRPIGTEC